MPGCASIRYTSPGLSHLADKVFPNEIYLRTAYYSNRFDQLPLFRHAIFWHSSFAHAEVQILRTEHGGVVQHYVLEGEYETTGEMFGAGTYRLLPKHADVGPFPRKK